jgi:hypothetical protein
MRKKMNLIATCFAIAALPGVGLVVACGAPPDGQEGSEDVAQTAAHDGLHGRVGTDFVFVCDVCNEDQTGPATSTTVPGGGHPPPPPPVPTEVPTFNPAPIIIGIGAAGH